MGFEKTIIKEGDGTTYPKKGNKLAMHYIGRLEDETEFDSSVSRGKPFEFTIGVGQVIKGWDEGVITMSLGEKCFLKCSPDYAYGAAGYPPVIPKNATLIFEVELLKIY